MPSEEIDGVVISSFPNASTIENNDVVTGLHNGNNANFLFSGIAAYIRQGLSNIFVPWSRIGTPNGAASLDSTGKVPSSQLPSIPSDASDITYDPTTSGLSATNVQDAVDEVQSEIDNLPSPPVPSDANPQDLDTAAAGSSADYSRADHVHNKPTAADIGAQEEITASGILMGDGQGGVSAAVAGTDYQAPLTAGTDYATPGMIPTVPSAYTSNPAMDGTASPGSSGAWARGDHVHPSDTSRVPVYGLGKNLLDNWYFLNPVNQRGKSSYTAAGYTIDRLKAANNQCITEIVSGGLKIRTSDGTTRVWQMLCDTAMANALSGKTGTVSVIENGVLLTKTGTFGTAFEATGTFTYRVNTSGGDILRIIGSSSTGATITAAKVELGSQQTLAHLEGSTWVLNEIPDYEEELIKCQTSTADSSDTYANKSLATEQQLAYVETGTTASRTYAVGEYFCWNGLLHRAKTAISSGQSFTPGTNCEQVPEGIGNSLQAISTTSITPTSVNPLPSGVTGTVFVTRIGKLRFVNLYNIILASFSPGATICTLGQGDRPNPSYRGDYGFQVSARSTGNWVQATQKVCFVRFLGSGDIVLYGDYTAGWYITGTLIIIAEG